MGNLVWDAISEFEEERKREVYEARRRFEQNYGSLAGDRWLYDVRSGRGSKHGGQDVRW